MNTKNFCIDHINILSCGTCRINTPMNNIIKKNNKFKCMEKIILTNTRQLVILLKYTLNILSKEEKSCYLDIMNSCVFLQHSKNFLKIFRNVNILTLEISTTKIFCTIINKKKYILSHDYSLFQTNIDKKKVFIEHSTISDMIDDINFIKKYFSNIIVVSHIDNHIVNNIRKKLIIDLKKVCDKTHTFFINPTVYVDVNRKKYLEDNEHYSLEGYKLIQTIYEKEVILLYQTI